MRLPGPSGPARAMCYSFSMVRSSARDVTLLAVCQALFLTSMSAVIASAALIGHGLAETKVLATLPIGIQFVMTMVATVPASLLMKRIGRREGFTVGASIGLAGALFGLWGIVEGSFTLFCIGLALIGGANGFAQYYRFAAADAASEAFKSRAISLVLAGGVIASVGPLMADWTKDLFSPIAFAGVFAAVAALYVATLAVLRFITIPPPDADERSSGGRPLLVIMRQPVFVVAVLGSLVGYAMMSLLMTATPLAMMFTGFGFSESAQTIQWHVLGMFAPAFVTGHLIRRFGTLRIMACGALLIGLCAAANIHGIALANFQVALVLLGVGWNFLFTGGTTLVTEIHTPAEKAKTQAAHDFTVFTGVAAAALLSGALHEAVGWQTMNYAVLPFLGIVLAGLAWLALSRRRPAPSAAE